MNDGLMELERRLSAVESELNHTRAILDRQRTGARISAWLGRATWIVGLVIVTGATTHGAGKAGPTPLTVKAPFIVVDDAGMPIASVLNHPELRGIEYDRADGSEAGRAGCMRDGSARMSVQSPDGNQRCLLAALPEGLATMQLYEKGKLCTAIGNSEKGTALVLFDADGKAMFKVAELDKVRYATILNDKEIPVALLRTFDDNGMLKILDGQETQVIQEGINPTTHTAQIKMGPIGKTALDLGMGSNAHMAIKIYNPAGKMVAGLGDAGESGALSINDPEGGVLASIMGVDKSGQIAIATAGSASIRAKMGLDAGKAGFYVFNGAKQNVARLSEAPDSASGYLSIGDPTGVPMVEAGHANGVGLVRTGPSARALVPGAPGSFIIGRH
jgi:hypothetical protein